MAKHIRRLNVDEEEGGMEEGYHPVFGTMLCTLCITLYERVCSGIVEVTFFFPEPNEKIRDKVFSKICSPSALVDDPHVYVEKLRIRKEFTR